MQNIYYRYSTYLKDKYGEKTYKLPINLPVTCPNRDGALGSEGCAFCGDKAAGFESLPSELSVQKQLLENKDYIGQRYGAKKFIAYFQNFSNTYLPLEQLLDYVKEALQLEDVVEVSLSTRPDCLSREYIVKLVELMSAHKREVNLSLELGLQTVNYHTLQSVNRGHTLAEFIDAVLLAKEVNVEVGAHLILNLPGDGYIDAIENAKILSALKVDNVKLHALYICEGTQLGRLFKQGKLEMITQKEYIDRVIAFLEYLNPRIAVQRLLGRAPEEDTLFCNWGHSWWKIHDTILAEMKASNTYQGKKFNYLNGKALAKFED